MIWNNVSDFWAMGGYAFYVWGSFGVTAGAMAIEVLWAKRAQSKALEDLKHAALAQTQPESDWS